MKNNTKEEKEKVPEKQNAKKGLIAEWGTRIGLGSSLTGSEASVTFGSGTKNGENYTYRRDTANVPGGSITITDKNGIVENTKLFIFPWDKRRADYDYDISGVTSFDDESLNNSFVGPFSFSSDGAISVRISFYFVAGFDFTIGYNFGDDFE